MLRRANEVVETRDVTWEALPVMMVQPVQLLQPVLPEPTGASELGRTPQWAELREISEPGGLDDSITATGEKSSSSASSDLSSDEHRPC